MPSHHGTRLHQWLALFVYLILHHGPRNRDLVICYSLFFTCRGIQPVLEGQFWGPNYAFTVSIDQHGRVSVSSFLSLSNAVNFVGQLTPNCSCDLIV